MQKNKVSWVGTKREKSKIEIYNLFFIIRNAPDFILDKTSPPPPPPSSSSKLSNIIYAYFLFHRFPFYNIQISIKQSVKATITTTAAVAARFFYVIPFLSFFFIFIPFFFS